MKWDTVTRYSCRDRSRAVNIPEKLLSVTNNFSRDSRREKNPRVNELHTICTIIAGANWSCGSCCTSTQQFRVRHRAALNSVRSYNALFVACRSCRSLELNGSYYCEWNYNGLGLDYQILAGPSFILVYTIVGIILGVAADRYNR